MKGVIEMSKKKRSANFNKLFATTALATAAVVVPTAVVGAEDAKGIPVETVQDFIIKQGDQDQKINYTIEADLTKITGEYIIEKYEWFYVENINGVDTEFLILEATSKTLKVPLEALGKEIQVRVTAQKLDGNGDPEQLNGQNVKEVFIAKNRHKVENIEVIMGTISLVGASEAEIGDIITIGEIALKDKVSDTELKFENNQINYSYQWYVKEDSKYNAIQGETNRSIEVTSKLEDKTVAAFVSFEFNGKEYSKFTQSETLANISNDIKSLIGNIDTLMGGLDEKGQDQYQQVASYETLLENLKKYKQQYNDLTELAKKQITNLEILSELETNISIVDAFVKEIRAARAKTPSEDGIPNQTNQLTESQIKSLEQVYQSLQSKYDSLDSLQRSLLELRETEVEYEKLKKDLESLFENQQVEGLDDLNERIINLFLKDGLFSSYNGELEHILEEFVAIKEDIKKVDKQLTPYLKLNIVKQIEEDIKRVEAVVKRITKIEQVTIDKKKATATAAYKAYIALTPLQKSLITDEQFKIIEAGIDIKDEKLSGLNNDIINELLDLNDEGIYIAYKVDLSSANELVNELLARYKMLTSAEKKFITNYRYLTTAVKDIKAAQKVEKLFEEAEELKEKINDIEQDKAILSATKKAISKYKSAIAAYAKLSKMQQPLITNDLLNNVLESYTELNEAQIPETDTDLSLIDAIEKLIDRESLKYTENIPSFQQSVDKLMQQYKNLPSKDRKAIYNYSTLTIANSDIKKASSVLSKLQAAANAKDQKKYNSALATYNKLTALQQSLIDKNTIDTSGLEELKDVVEEVEVAVDALQKDDANIDDINDAKKLYDALSSSQKKLVSNYNLLKDLLKDVSTVKSFVSKLDKLGYNPTLAQKESILKNYYKLSDRQVVLFKESYSYDAEFESPLERLIAFENDVNNKTTNAKNLNDSIRLFVDNIPDDLNEIKNELSRIDAEYFALPSTDQKLITNYSKLNRVKKDVEAVLKVNELKRLIGENDTSSPTYKDWKKAYNRLNSRQLDLYDNAAI